MFQGSALTLVIQRKTQEMAIIQTYILQALLDLHPKGRTPGLLSIQILESLNVSPILLGVRIPIIEHENKQQA